MASVGVRLTAQLGACCIELVLHMSNDNTVCKCILDDLPSNQFVFDNSSHVGEFVEHDVADDLLSTLDHAKAFRFEPQKQFSRRCAFLCAEVKNVDVGKFSQGN